MRPALAWLVVLAGASVGAGGGGGCSKNTLGTLVCSPSCPQGTHCSDSGCAVDEELPDLAAGGADGPGDCDPPCAAPSPHCIASHQCVPCLVDEHCPAGSVCSRSGPVTLCVPGCHDDAGCRGKEGSPSLRCCGGACVDSSSDPGNCGGCGNACAPAHALPTCAGGVCSPGECEPGWADCNHSPGDGCETGVRIDVANCTACGMACSFNHGVAACAGGCYLAACAFGYDDCNGDQRDGCEVSVVADPRNCGACGVVCQPAPHARFACVNAACQLTACDPGFADCDGNLVNGCEVAVASDVRNCGACGHACDNGLVCISGACTCPQCNIPNAKSACANNQCVLLSCLPGYADCNGDIKDGCETNIGNAPRNCGGCGTVCPQDTPVCFGGQCVKGCLYQTTVLGSNPIGYWPLDDMNGPVIDKGSTPHNGTIFGAPQMGVTGVSGTAMLFHGNNDHIRIGPVTSATTDQVSYELWVKLGAAPQAAITVLWDDDAQGGGDAWIEILPAGNVQVRRSPDGFVDFATVGTVAVGVWTHFVLVADQNGKRLYLNGALDGSSNTRINARTNRSYVTIGANFDGNFFPGGAQYFNGTIDEVAIYNYALSANDVASHYSAGCPQ